MSINFFKKTLYIINNWEVTNKLQWNEEITIGIQAISMACSDMASKILDRFNEWVDSVGYIIENNKDDDEWVSQTIWNVVRDLLVGERIDIEKERNNDTSIN